jgi:hypothetical protein
MVEDRKRIRWRLVATIGVLALVASACADGDEGPDDESPGTEEAGTMIDEMTGEMTGEMTRPAVPRGRAAGRFLLHLAEMVATMLVGMLVLGAAREGAVALGVPALPARPDLDAMLMVGDMVVAMTLWMRLRRHGWAAIGWMDAAMAAPFAVLLPLYWTGLVTAGGLMLWGHVLMVPAMAAAMLLRAGEYTGHGRAGHEHAGHEHAGHEHAGHGHGRRGLDLAWLGRRWPVALALVLFVLTTAPDDGSVPPWVVAGIAAMYPLLGMLRRSIRDRWTALLQAAGVAVFAGIAVLASVADPVTGALVVAAGLIGHAVWDAFHHRAGAVVWRWYAEACVYYDLLLAAAVVTAALV